MRDDFVRNTKDILAARVGHRCSNPACNAVTSGPAQMPSRAVNVGVAAHITAAAPGGPRYDGDLTSVQRSAADNGIWLCQTDAKLVDADPVLYTAALLRRWKSEAEARIGAMIASGSGQVDLSLDLAIPSSRSADSILSFANQGVDCVGRGDELAELQGFLGDDAPFAWWLWTGPAGVGKSRLAVELCRAVSSDWHAGFIREAHESRLVNLRAALPTLVVVDYAAQRSAWLADVLAQLGRRDRGTKIRILILERQARGVWWESTLRRGRLEESLNIDKTMYALPRQLGGLDRDAFCVVIKTTAEQLGHGNLTSTQIEDIADRAEEIDLDGRPLLIQVATLDWLHRTTGSGGRDATLRRLIGRSVVQLRERIGDDSIATLANNAQVFTTALGGLTVENYARVLSGFTQPATLLPDVFQVMGSVTLDHLVDGVRPDILGELFVLDQLDVEGVTRLSTISLMTFAARVDQDAYHGFVERAAADHAEHPRLRDLLAAAWSDEAPAVGAELATATIPLLKRSDHPVIAWIFEQLNGISDQLSPDTARRLSATARFRIANLVFGEGDHTRACSDFTEALALCDPAWPERGNILNNRGIVQLELGRLDLAIADFSLVIDTTTTSNEARACALNNRADVFRDSGDLASSIADRTAVLALDNTTYNRRYIAFARRALAFQQIGDHGGAFRDIAAILGTSDIAAEQKMSARLMRAEWLLDAGEVEAGRRDLDAILASRRNFDAVEHKARELRRWRPVRG